MKNKQIKIIFVIISILFIIPSVIYIFFNKTILGFNIYYNFFITEKISKTISTIIYITLFICMSILYLKMIKEKKMFDNIKEVLKYVMAISIIFSFMLPWTS